MSEAWKLSARHEAFESAAFLTFFVFLKWIPFGAVADRVFKECKSVGDSPPEAAALFSIRQC
jgi:hypothetical protein